MGSIGDSLPEGDIPAVGTSGTTYASELNLFLTEVKARLEAKVPKASLAAGALDQNGSAVQNTSYVGIQNAAGAPTTPSNSLQAFGGNLYWINTGGAVQITSGTTLNTSLVGGITGDYGGANPAQFRFVDADQEYYAYDDFAGGAWARLWAKNFDLAAGPTSSNRLRMAFGGGASYTLTFPTAVPASDAYVVMGSSGGLSTSTTIPVFAHSNKVLTLPPHMYQLTSSASYGFGASRVDMTASTNIILPVPLLEGDRILSVVFARKGNSSANIGGDIYVVRSSDQTETSIGTISVAAPSSTWADTTVNVTDTTLTSGDAIVINVTSSATGISIGNTRITYDRP